MQCRTKNPSAFAQHRHLIQQPGVDQLPKPYLDGRLDFIEDVFKRDSWAAHLESNAALLDAWSLRVRRGPLQGLSLKFGDNVSRTNQLSSCL